MSKRAWILLTIGVIAIVVAMLYLLDSACGQNINISRYKPEGQVEVDFSCIILSEYKVEAKALSDAKILELLNDSMAIEAQISKINNVPYINITVDEIVPQIEEKQVIINNKTYEVINHNTHQKEILTQDLNNQLILKDIDGKVLWQRQLDEEIIGEVIQIDYYKNNKLQYLFRTKSYIYLIDRNGNNTANFPVPYLNDDDDYTD